VRQCLDCLAARGVAAGVDDAVLPVPALPRDLEVAEFVQVEGHVQGDEAADILGALGHEHADGVLVAEAGAGDHGVLLVEDGRVVPGNGCGNAALGKPGIRNVYFVLGQNETGEAVADIERSIQAGDASPDDDDIVAERLVYFGRAVYGKLHRITSVKFRLAYAL